MSHLINSFNCFQNVMQIQNYLKKMLLIVALDQKDRLHINMEPKHFLFFL